MHSSLKPVLTQSTKNLFFFFLCALAAAGAPANRRGRGGGHRGRGRFNVRRDGPMKFEKDFDFESANAQFNKEEIDREFQSKLKLKGVYDTDVPPDVNMSFSLNTEI